ncbi:MAG: V-type ATP synthase subunit E, partial [Nitrososphaerales archaeon]
AIESASEEYKAVLREKFEGARKILQESEDIVKTDVKKIEVETAGEVGALKKKVRGSADLTVKNETLKLVEEYVSKAFEGARRKLEHDFVKSKNYDRFLRNVIEEGAEKVGKGNLVLAANSKDIEKARLIVREVEKNLGIKIKIDKRPINCMGGVRIGDSDDTMHYDNTIEMRLSRAEASLRKNIAEIYLKGEEKIGS